MRTVLVVFCSEKRTKQMVPKRAPLTLKVMTHRRAAIVEVDEVKMAARSQGQAKRHMKDDIGIFFGTKSAGRRLASISRRGRQQAASTSPS